MPRTFCRSIASLACTVLLASASLAHVSSEPGSKPETAAPQSASAKPSPPATATVTLNGKTITIKYSAPSMRGRKIMGELVPYGKVWRTGANEATSFVTDTNLKVGTLSVPAGSYTLFTLPNANQWLLIVNKQTGQWGLTYDETQDLGRTPMKASTLSAPQEKMSISFEHTSGNSTVLHIRWENTDQSVQITAQ